MNEGVAGPRTYVSPLRRRQAEQTHERVFSAATRLFAQRGYTRTSVRQIAAEAEVSVETVYAVGGKAAIFLGAFERAFSRTADGDSLLELDVLAPVWAAATLREAVEGMCAFLVETNARSAGLWKAYVEGANIDAHLAEAYAVRMRAAREDGRRVVAALVRRGLCPAPVDGARAVDANWLALHPSQYVLLVGHAGWSLREYREWLVTTVLANLSGPAGPTAAPLTRPLSPRRLVPPSAPRTG